MISPESLWESFLKTYPKPTKIQAAEWIGYIFDRWPEQVGSTDLRETAEFFRAKIDATEEYNRSLQHCAALTEIP